MHIRRELFRVACSVVGGHVIYVLPQAHNCSPPAICSNITFHPCEFCFYSSRTKTIRTTRSRETPTRHFLRLHAAKHWARQTQARQDAHLSQRKRLSNKSTITSTPGPQSLAVSRECECILLHPTIVSLLHYHNTQCCVSAEQLSSGCRFDHTPQPITNQKIETDLGGRRLCLDLFVIIVSHLSIDV